MNTTIRYLQKSDLPHLEKLLRPMWLLHATQEEDFIKRKSLQDIELNRYFAKSLNKRNEFALIALYGNKIVGVIRVEKVRLEDFFKIRTVYYLDDLVIEKKHRRQGIATMLVKEVKKIAKKNNIKGLKTRTYEFNKTAIKFLESVELKKLYSEYYSKL